MKIKKLGKINEETSRPKQRKLTKMVRLMIRLSNQLNQELLILVLPIFKSFLKLK